MKKQNNEIKEIEEVIFNNELWAFETNDCKSCEKKGNCASCELMKKRIRSVATTLYDFGYRKENEKPKSDKNSEVSHPSHYTDGKIEVIDYILDKHFDFCLGNVIKYVSRAGKKKGNSYLSDLKKARQYIEFAISAAETEKNEN